MAPVKRGRAAEESVEVLESASSNLRGNNQKRPRLSNIGSHSDEETPDLLIDEGDGAYTATQRRLGGNRENYERERDEISDNEDDEAAVERATQDIRREKKSQPENQAAEAGVIESITCQNFMCHTNLHITLGPLINFIIGHNGSGKSAVLTALTLCLGGKAVATNRGQNLKSFIKEGEETCTLTVKIKNQGDQGYRQDIYGDSIIVERYFSLHGSPGFRVKNSNGKMVSNKRYELDEITDFFAMQLDNPVNVLTQDMARQFLNSSTEVEKYKFFIKGVQLEQLDNDYTLLSDSLDNADALMENVQDDMKVMVKNFDDANRKFELSQRQGTLRDKIGRLSRQMAWAQVEEQENNLAQLERQIEQAQTEIERRQETFTNSETAFDEASRAWEGGKSIQQELEASLDPLKEAQAEAKKHFDDNTKEIMGVVGDQKGIDQSMRAEQVRKKKLEHDIEEESQRLAAADGGAHASKLAEIDLAEAHVPQAKAEYENHRSKLPALELSLTAAMQKVGDIKSAANRKRMEVEEAEKRVQDLNTAQPRPYDGYDASILQVMRMIDAERNFHQKPIGPLGKYIKLLKPEWSSVLEGYLGGILNAFIVTDKHDQNILSNITSRCKYWGTINILTDSYLDPSQTRPDARFDTVLSVLEIANDIVRNQLIIGHSMDLTILIKDRNEGRRVMFDGPPPRNAKVCVCFHEKRGRGIRYSRGYGGSQKSDPVPGYDRTPRMGTDIETQIRLQHEIVHGLKQELNVVEEQKRAFEEDATKAKQAINRHKIQEKELRVQAQRAEDRVAELKGELEAATPMDGKLDGLKSQLSTLEDDINHCVRQFAESVAEKERLDGQAVNLKAALGAADNQVQQTTDQIRKGDQTVTKLADNRQRVLKKKNEHDGRVKDAQKEKEDHETHRDDLAANVESFIEQASEIGARVAVDRGETPATLDAKLRTMDDQIRRFEREIGGSSEEIAAALSAAKNALHTAQKQFRGIEDLADALRMSLNTRHGRWKRFRSMISTRARAGFTFLLSERDFKGRMLLDHKAKLLQLLVQPDSSRRGEDGRQTRTLSGGEKSFSTICLLLALWDAMGSPIRCLDEFDVFMDSVNRDVSMKMMIQAARGSVGRQFILITPQAMGNVDAGSDVKIIRMNDPERGQTTLNFAAGAVAAAAA